jgi:hypothetical protein
MDLHALGAGAVFLLAGGARALLGWGCQRGRQPSRHLDRTGPAAALLAAPSLATNVAQCRGSHWPRLLAMLWPAWLTLGVVTVWAPEVSTEPLPINAQAFGPGPHQLRPVGTVAPDSPRSGCG